MSAPDDITVATVKDRKRYMDVEILAAIKRFEDETGAHVSGVNTVDVTVVGCAPRVVEIDTEVTL